MTDTYSPPSPAPAALNGGEATRMHAEAAEAGAIVARQLADNAALLRNLAARIGTLGPSMVLTCARGSSDHAATFAKYLFETHLALPTLSHAPSVSSIYGRAMPTMKDQLFLAISQSGRSPDLLASARLAREAGALLVAIVNDGASPLAETADIVIPMLAGPETSVAATKTYIATLAALAQLAQAMRPDKALGAAIEALPETLAAAWEADWSAAEALLAPLSNLYVLGRGLTLGAAQEAALKFKETSGIHAEAFSIAEVAHGPMALVGPHFPVLVFAPSAQAAPNLETILTLVTERGAPVLLAGKTEPPSIALPVAGGLHPVIEPIAMIQSFYRMINALAVRRGHDPDNPPMLQKVTRTL